MLSDILEISKDVLIVMFDVLDMAFEEDFITRDVMYIQIEEDSNSTRRKI
jgi:hypothetical protein